MENNKEVLKQVKEMKVESIDAKTSIKKPKFDVDDENVKKEFLKKFLEAGKDGSK